MGSDVVQRHYTRGGLQEAVLEALVAAGHDPDHLDPEALTPAEEFHTFGGAGTVALAEAAAVLGDDAVLDVGSGLGGPARHLARRYGCRVLGVDLTAELCEVANDLTRRVGLADRVAFQQGDARALPYRDGAFDVVWTQHATMNIPDKPRLFAELRRVLRPGGRLAFFDILAGSEQPLLYPVPWAEEPAANALASVAETRALLAGVDLGVRVWDNVTAEAGAFYGAIADATEPRPALGLGLLVGDLTTKMASLRRNVEQRRVVVVRAVAVAEGR